ncbi:hypothetical protein QBC37DRAFT_398757 [Rhypophila decipiens]|uniref:Formylmethionine deformylase-like protein n=1 Tax=Rhypophila decipiens TaxID=261697 RepID=A0AAN7B9U2_9PEZI|nr:hypothetical protein QBC37DRAFT_398757 [Rhypophila decipiens]
MEPRRGDPHAEGPTDSGSYRSPRMPLHRSRPSEQWFALGSTPDQTPDPPQLEVTPPIASHHAPRKHSPFHDDDDDEPEPPSFSTIGLGISSTTSPTPNLSQRSPEIIFSQESPPTPGFPVTPSTPYKSTDFLLGRSDHLAPNASLDADHSPYEYAGHSRQPPARTSRRSKDWSWLWRWIDPSWVMYEMLLIGIILAVGHHVFYSRLDGKPADDQLQMMRYGNFLSYAAKSFLATSIIFAYKQQIWATVRRKNLELGTIDSLFAAVDDLRAFLNWDFARRAKVALGLAIVFWLLPLTVILAPATLTVAPRVEYLPSQTCASVRTLNFEAEKAKNWRNADKIDGRPGLSLSLWNCTLPMSGENFSPYNETFFDYWTSSSWQTDLVTTLSAYGDRVVPRADVASQTCGTGWNCSYTISFTGPGYKCAEVARGRDDNTEGLARMGSPFNTSWLLPDGDHAYVAHATLGDYSTVQIEAQPGGVPLIQPPYPQNLGAFRTEPVLWIGHSDWTSPNNESVPLNRVESKNWNTSFVPKIFRCEHYVTDYTVLFNHTFLDQVATVLNRTYRHPIVDTTFVRDKDANDGTMDNITAIPESNYIMPLDVSDYRLAGAYHSLGSKLRAVINGTIQYTPWIVADTDAMKTTLINKSTYLVADKFMTRIQSFYENMLLSLLSNPQFIVVSWAAKPDLRSGIGNSTTANDESLRYPCTKTRVINAYAYRARDLWIVYTIAIVVSIISVAFGAAALAQNNYHVRDTALSSIVAATRAPCLDQLPWKSSKWGEVPPEIKETKMGYGIVTDDVFGRSTPNLNAGMEDDMFPLREGGGTRTGRESFGSGDISLMQNAAEMDYVRSATSIGVDNADLASNHNVHGQRVYYGFAPEEFFIRRRNLEGRKQSGPADFKKGAKKVWTFKTWEPAR